MVENEIVSFRGTRQGILMSVSEEESFYKAIKCLEYKIDSNRDFFAGSPISLDLGWREIEEEEIEKLLTFFKKRELSLLGVISSSLNTRRICEERGLKVIIGRLGLADHHGRKTRHPRKTTVPKIEEKVQVVRETEPISDTLMIQKTIRSGQTIEHTGNLIIMGDVNPGAVVKAGKNLVVLGALRGVGQAGLNGNSDEPVIIALKFQPTQVKLGDALENKFDNKIIRSKQPVIVSRKNGKLQFQIYR